jgi:hypothetical protein
VPICSKLVAFTKFRGKARLVSAFASSSVNKPGSLQRFTVARPAQPAGVTGIAAKARPIPSSDPFGVERFERSRAKTPQGYARAFNSVSRELIGLPLTRKQQDEIRAQRPKLKPEEIDKNIYRTPEIRERAPRDMPARRKPGWVCRQFVLPRPIVEGLMFLAKAKAQEEFAHRSSQPRGLRRAFPRTANFYVAEALNSLLADYGLSQFCVPEAEPVPGRVRRFVIATD